MDIKKGLGSVIFDCDGVLFDSRQANINFYNHILARFNLPSMKDEDIAFVHMGTADESIRHIFRGTPYLEEAQKYRKEVDYTPFIADMIMEPGLKELLGRLSPRYGLAVATNRSNTIGYLLESTGLKEFFDIVVSSLDVDNPKPHPESIYKILRFFDLRPDQAVYVGDSLIDYETARAAGLHFVSYRNRELDTPFKAENMMEIEGILNSIEKLGGLTSPLCRAYPPQVPGCWHL